MEAPAVKRAKKPVRKTLKKRREQRARLKAVEQARAKWTASWERADRSAQGEEGVEQATEAGQEGAEKSALENAVQLALQVEQKIGHEDGDGNGVDPPAAEGADLAVGEDASDRKQAAPAALSKKKRKMVDSNWAALKGTVGASARRRKPPLDTSAAPAAEPKRRSNSEPSVRGRPTRIMAVDCEMVGVGTNGRRSALARVALVNSKLECVYHAWVKPQEKVTDYRTEFSGVRAEDIHSKKAVSFQEAQKAVGDFLKGKLLVGHAVANDLDVLLLSHPRHSIRDTSKASFIREAVGVNTKKARLGLKRLTAEILGQEIQSGEHDPVEDARATMRLYLKFARVWEQTEKEKANGITEGKKAADGAKVKASGFQAKKSAGSKASSTSRVVDPSEKATESFFKPTKTAA